MEDGRRLNFVINDSFVSMKLNYSVVGGTEEPENPTENMIWINTENEITKVVFRNTEPSNPVEDMVFIYTGATSNVSFDRIVVGGIGVDDVHPLNAKQYVDSVWVSKTAKIYQNGKWVDWFIYLLLKNNQYTDLTGGWTTNGFTYGSIGFAGSSASEDGVIINASLGLYCGVCTAKKVNFSKYRKLTFVFSEWKEHVGVLFSTSTNVNDSSALVAQYTVSMDDSGHGQIDISDVSGSCYLVIMPGMSTLLTEVRVEL